MAKPVSSKQFSADRDKLAPLGHTHPCAGRVVGWTENDASAEPFAGDVDLDYGVIGFGIPV